MLAEVADADSSESGITEITSEVFVAYHRGLGRAVASAATAQALDTHLLPQWRARPEPSRRIAAALGYQEVGAQISFSLDRRHGA